MVGYRFGTREHDDGWDAELRYRATIVHEGAEMNCRTLNGWAAVITKAEQSTRGRPDLRLKVTSEEAMAGNADKRELPRLYG